MSDFWENATYLIDDKNWATLKRRAAKKDTVSDSAAWTRRWNPDFNLCGEIGEWLFGWLVGAERRAGFGDGGRDFGDVDVKTSSHFASPKLLRHIDDSLRAEAYALVAADLGWHRARYVGYCYRDELIDAPVVEYGYGPTRTVHPKHLRPDLPMREVHGPVFA